jgi:hypothetical protein
MTTKKMELTEEEQALIAKLRGEKEAEEQALASKSQLEKDFRNEIKVVHSLINLHIENAKAELEKAVQVSEKSGIPFRSGIVDMTESWNKRLYTPKSFSKKWGKMDLDILDDYDIYGTHDVGWQYWNTSSLTC